MLNIRAKSVKNSAPDKKYTLLHKSLDQRILNSLLYKNFGRTKLQADKMPNGARPTDLIFSSSKHYVWCKRIWSIKFSSPTDFKGHITSSNLWYKENDVCFFFRFDIISDCWNEAFDLRPTFEELAARIKKIKNSDEVISFFQYPSKRSKIVSRK